MTLNLNKIKTALFSVGLTLVVCAVVFAASGSIRSSALTGIESDAADSGYILGDANCDGDVNINDVTDIQKSIAGFTLNDKFSKQAADADDNGIIEIADATVIQKWLASMDIPYPVGTRIEPPAPETTESPTDVEGWGREIFRP